MWISVEAGEFGQKLRMEEQGSSYESRGAGGCALDHRG
jgi:hypothetical protein